MENNPHKKGKDEEGKSLSAIITGIAPFNISSISVISPAKGPAALATLVAPILPLPTFLGSSPLNSFDTIIPKGIDPMKKLKIKSIIFIFPLLQVLYGQFLEERVSPL